MYMSKYILYVCICYCMYNGEIMHVVTNFIRKKKVEKPKTKEKQGRKEGMEMKPTICSQQQTNHKIHYY